MADIETMLKNHDWYFDYSDDGRVWERGRASRDAILQALRALPLEGARQLWANYAPKDFPFLL